MPTDIATLLQEGIASLRTSLTLDTAEARLEVQMLLQAVLKVPRAYLLAHPERVLSETELSAWRDLLQRRLAGEPMAHILGEREFFGLNLKVTPATLIPRPETELLVELALERLRGPSHEHPNPPQPSLVREGAIRVLDLGTGTGAIALAIAHARPDVDVLAVDASPDALEVARENARRLGIANVSFIQSDWFSALEGRRFDLIVSNPPYIAAGDAHLGQGDVRFEPLSALVSGADGLDDIRRIVGESGAFLEQGAWLLLEHGYDQPEQVRSIFKQNGFDEIFSAKDIAGIDRVSGGENLR